MKKDFFQKNKISILLISLILVFQLWRFFVGVYLFSVEFWHLAIFALHIFTLFYLLREFLGKANKNVLLFLSSFFILVIVFLLFQYLPGSSISINGIPEDEMKLIVYPGEDFQDRYVLEKKEGIIVSRSCVFIGAGFSTVEDEPYTIQVNNAKGNKVDRFYDLKKINPWSGPVLCTDKVDLGIFFIDY